MSGNEKKNLQLVKVFVRQRPVSNNEIELRRPTVVHQTSQQEISIKSGNIEKKYTFDGVFDPWTTQVEVYETVVAPSIEYILAGYTCTVFAYGQTGSGKTHTMIGQNIAACIDFTKDPSVGMIPRAAIHLFSELAKLNLTYTVSVTFVEIYNEEIRDLLIADSPPLRVYDDLVNKGATCIKGVTEIAVTNTTDVFDLVNIGAAVRQTAATNLNRQSSRSHTIFTLVVNIKEATLEGEEIIKTGKLHLIDLAGSENIGKSGATEMRAREAGTINKSLLTLGKVIKALVVKSQHVPYRESKLTRILQDSLGGTSKTCMIATFSPCVDSFDETVSTLDYAHMTRSVANCPTVNINRNQSNVLKELQNKVGKLRLELNAAREGEGFYVQGSNYEKMTLDIKQKQDRILHLMKEVADLKKVIDVKQQHYNDLNRTFEKTRITMESIGKELKEENERKVQNENAIKELNEEIIYFNDVINKLLYVYETSTRHQEIYHRKYDSQSDSSIHNANVARKIYSTVVGSLDKMGKKWRCYCENQQICLDEVSTKVDSLEENQRENLQDLHQILSEIRSQSDNHRLSFDSLFKNEGYGQEQLLSSFLSIYDESYKLQMAKLHEMKDIVRNFSSYVDEKSVAIKEQVQGLSNQIDREFMIINEQTRRAGNLMQVLNVDLEKRERYIQEQLVCARRKKALYEDIINVHIADSESSSRELECVSSILATNDMFEDETGENSLKPLSTVTESLNSLNGFLEPLIIELKILLESAIINIEEIGAASKAEIESRKNKTQDHFLEFIKVSGDKLNCYNEDIKSTLMNWVIQLNLVKESLHSVATEHCTYIDGNMEQISVAARSYENELKQFIEQSTEVLKNLRNDLILKIHEGDTPVKSVYNYPRKL